MNLSHPGATAYIVGRGPSLARLTADDFGAGPVISLNAAIHHVRTLGLANPIYYLWKDGCLPHTPLDNDPGIHDCALPFPRHGEVFLTSLAEGRFCLTEWKDRHVIDVEAEFGVPWWTMSAPVAVEIAHAMGVAELVMYGHDAFTDDDNRRIEEDGRLVDDPHAGYYNAGAMSQAAAQKHGLPIRWATKVPR